MQFVHYPDTVERPFHFYILNLLIVVFCTVIANLQKKGKKKLRSCLIRQRGAVVRCCGKQIIWVVESVKVVCAVVWRLKYMMRIN